MDVWVRGLVLVLGLLAGCSEPSTTENPDQNRINIYLVGSGWGTRHNFTIREDDHVSEYFYLFELHRRLFDNGERRVSGVAPGAYASVKALMEELDFANLEDLCGGDSMVYISDAGDTFIQISENGERVKAAQGCGNGDRETTPEYNAAWEAIERAIKGFVEQGAGTIPT